MSRRVVVTGIGMVTPLGNDVESTWEALCAGRSGVGPITQFDASNQDVRFAAEVRGFDPTPYFENKKEIRRNDPFVHFAMAASKQALDDSGFRITEENADRVGVLMAQASAACTRCTSNSTRSSRKARTASVPSSSRCT